MKENNSPLLIEEGIKTLTKSGYYIGKEDIFKDAFRALLEIKPELRTAISIGMYKEGKISLNRVAEIAGVTTEEMKEILVSRGVKIKRGISKVSERRKKAKELLKIKDE
ncbi:MAG: UPF0175 family protein [Candidatus Aenigmarchaeota archaeon]|nr:UPF0175 family protein [Candidatus Aenigmarchaeota archaeon]